MGMIKSGEYVPCGASATLMSQYPMKPMTDAITFNTNITEFTAQCAGVFYAYLSNSGSQFISINGVTVSMHGHADIRDGDPDGFVLNKDDTIAVSDGILAIAGRGCFRPFAVGEIL